MKNLVKSIICASLLTFGFSITAQEAEDRWVFVTQSDNSNIFFDKKTLNDKVVWVKYETLPSKYKEEKVKQAFVKYAYLCQPEKQTANLGGYHVNLAGESVSDQGGQAWKYVYPETTGEAILDAICGK